MPSKVFTPWWRLLHDRVSVRSRLHALNSTKFPSPLCALCCEVEEDTYHMLADEDIWRALTTLHDRNGSPVDPSVLELLGAAFYSLWAYHWRCTIDDIPWQTQTVFSSFLTDSLV
ncbi:hypothetical protein MUCCIDRAFT_104841 [Mucor lusitanicus CBS 277.49]|uniref:Reverse transcriptase zinc-binding domain-containing protein n=1 Tax=Mucor lusitanicus CBS 277.49 TaxID=747725 RepID=A0A162ZUF0_MUCCL|nr:hypothetical protein MUCCIDRAFT_104836 [Mucor lusitanicus CBS 277.49]OAD07891.1 hypothetical protein MUCCIDRAFT_104841 [Mucor lusitanicus CBS 277.49]